MYQEMVKQAEDKYKVKSEHPKTEEGIGLVDNFSSRWVNEFELPNGYIFKDENGNIINATKIVLEKKKKEYPKTYEECCELLSLGEDGRLYTKGYKASLIQDFQKLLICRDAYWKIAGEEMGLRKSWEPDWEDEHQEKYIIGSWLGTIQALEENFVSHPFAFPSEEMRDAFYENFKKLIKSCKELL
jgi:hypothetical protein